MIPFDEFGSKLDAIRALLDKDPASNEPMKLMCDLVGDMAKRLCEMDSAIDALDEFTENIDCRLDLFEDVLDEGEELDDDFDVFDNTDEEEDESEEESNDESEEESEEGSEKSEEFTCTGNCASCQGGCALSGANDDDDDTVYVDCVCPNCGKTFFVDVDDAIEAESEAESDDVMFTCPHCQSKVKVILEYDDDDDSETEE